MNDYAILDGMKECIAAGLFFFSKKMIYHVLLERK
jgi:hypothetical protein